MIYRGSTPTRIAGRRPCALAATLPAGRGHGEGATGGHGDEGGHGDGRGSSGAPG